MTRRGSECGGGAWTSAAAGTRRDGSALPKVTAAGTRCRGSGPRSYLVYRTRKSRLQIQVVCRIGTGFYILRCFIWMLTPSSHLKAVAGGVEKHTLLPFLQLRILYLPLRCAPQHWPLGSLPLTDTAGASRDTEGGPAQRPGECSGAVRAYLRPASTHASRRAAASRHHSRGVPPRPSRGSRVAPSPRQLAASGSRGYPSACPEHVPPFGGDSASCPPKRSRGPPGSRNRPGAIESGRWAGLARPERSLDSRGRGGDGASESRPSRWRGIDGDQCDSESPSRRGSRTRFRSLRLSSAGAPFPLPNCCHHPLLHGKGRPSAPRPRRTRAPRGTCKQWRKGFQFLTRSTRAACAGHTCGWGREGAGGDVRPPTAPQVPPLSPLRPPARRG